jgi:hypothetical protein
MREVAAGARHPGIVGMRHDVDNKIEPAVAFAAWEADRGYRSTYYILHTAPYWSGQGAAEVVAGADRRVRPRDRPPQQRARRRRREPPRPARILEDAVDELRGYGYDVRSTVAHGDSLCYGEDGQVRFVNDELFVECARPQLGAPDRDVAGVKIQPIPLAALGFDFDANWVGRGKYLSDSGGCWSNPGFDDTAAGFPFDGQLHMLVHPCWWSEAFVPAEIAA